jgi:hypothetical protein
MHKHTRKTLLAAVRFSPTAPDLREISMTTGLFAALASNIGVWNCAITSWRYG